MDIQFIYNGGASKRYHTVDTLRTQDIAAHSFGVAWLCEVLTLGGASKNLIMAALAHDLAEHIVGDIPSPAKRAMGIGPMFNDHETKLLMEYGVGKYEERLHAHELRTLKMADMMDGMLFCVRERALGNLKVAVVYANFKRYTEELAPFSHGEQNTFELINKEWEDVNGRQ